MGDTTGTSKHSGELQKRNWGPSDWQMHHRDQASMLPTGAVLSPIHPISFELASKGPSLLPVPFSMGSVFLIFFFFFSKQSKQTCHRSTHHLCWTVASGKKQNIWDVHRFLFTQSEAPDTFCELQLLRKLVRSVQLLTVGSQWVSCQTVQQPTCESSEHQSALLSPQPAG